MVTKIFSLRRGSSNTCVFIHINWKKDLTYPSSPWKFLTLNFENLQLLSRSTYYRLPITWDENVYIKLAYRLAAITQPSPIFFFYSPVNIRYFKKSELATLLHLTYRPKVNVAFMYFFSSFYFLLEAFYPFNRNKIV